MRPQKVNDIDILTGLANIFRSKGYEGASLKELSEATGLKKASLYHRFPKGKQEMAEAVLLYLDDWVGQNVIRHFLDDNLTPTTRLQTGLNGIKQLYNGGNEICIFRALSMQTGLELFESQIKQGMQEWISALKSLGEAFGLNLEAAENQAVQTLIQIQGSLIVSKGLADLSVFENTLNTIEHTYLTN